MGVSVDLLLVAGGLCAGDIFWYWVDMPLD